MRQKPKYWRHLIWKLELMLSVTFPGIIGRASDPSQLIFATLIGYFCNSASRAKKTKNSQKVGEAFIFSGQDINFLESSCDLT